MAVVYPGLVNIDNSQIEVTTVNVYDESQKTNTYDLTSQFPDWDAEAVVADQIPLQRITLPHPARINTIMIILDGLTLSPQLETNGPGDYKIINSQTVELLWNTDELPRRHSAEDTPVLLARYTLA